MKRIKIDIEGLDLTITTSTDTGFYSRSMNFEQKSWLYKILLWVINFRANQVAKNRVKEEQKTKDNFKRFKETEIKEIIIDKSVTFLNREPFYKD